MRFSLVFCFFLTFLSLTIAQSEQHIQGYISHANTHFWLGRYWQNDLDEFRVAKKYLDTALIELTKSDLDTITKLDYFKQISIFQKEIDDIEVICVDNLNGRFPLFMGMMGDIDNYEYFDDPLEISMEESLDKLLQMNMFEPSKPLREFMNFAVIEVYPYNSILEEVCAQYINNNSNTYVISRHEISLLNEKLDSTYTSSQLIKLGRHFNSNSIGIYKVRVLDIIDNIYYTGADFEYIDLNSFETISKTSSEHLIVDKTGLQLKGILVGLGRMIPAFILVSILFIQLLTFKKESSLTSIGKTLQILKGGLIGFLVSAILSTGVIFLIRLYAPAPDSFYLQPISLIWHYSITVFLGIFVPIVVLQLIVLISKRTFISDSFSRFVTFFGIIFGTFLPVAYFDYLVFEDLSSSLSIVLFLVLSLISAYFSAEKHLGREFLGEGNTNVITIFFFLIPLSVFYFFFFRFGDNFLLTHYGIIIGIYGLAILAYFKLDNILTYISNIPLFEEPKENQLKPGKIGDLANALNNTIAFNKHKLLIPFNSNSIDLLTQYFTKESNDGCINVLHIDGPSGIGKTALVNWYCENQLEGSSNMVFYGDCNESEDGNTIPYEPFSKAFSTFLGGSGIFKRGDSDAKQFVKLFEIGLQESTIGSMALSMLDKGSFDGASTREICKVLEHYLGAWIKEKCKEKYFPQLVLIIDDIHFIDDNSLELLKEFISMINRLNRKLEFKFYLIIISTPEIANTEAYTMLLEYLKKDIQLNYALPLGTMEDIQKPLLVDKDFSRDFLDSCGIQINYLSKKKIINYFEDHNFYNPAHILESLNFILKHDWFEEHNGQLELSKEADFDNIPLPAQLKFIYADKFNQLDDKLKRILEAASFVGETFEAGIVSKIWNIDRLELLHLLRYAENEGLVVDLSNQDDLYKFTSKRLVSEIKNIASRSTSGNGPSQLVKEYHKMITKIMIDEKQIDPEIYDLNIVSQLADRTYFTRDQMAEEAFSFNFFAAVRTKDKLNTRQASIYLKRLTEILKESDFEVGDVYQLKVQILELKLMLVHLNKTNYEAVLRKSEETEVLFRKLLGNDDCEEELTLYSDFFLDMLQLHYDILRYLPHNSSEKEAYLQKVRNKCKAEYPEGKQDKLLQLAQAFYLCEIDLFGKDNKRLLELRKIKQELEDLNQVEVLLYGRVINTLARIYQNEESEQLWLRRLVLILSMNHIDQKPETISDVLDLIKKNFHELDFQGKSDTMITLSSAGFYYLNKQNYKQALRLFQIVKTQKLFFGDYVGYSMTGNGEGLSHCELYKLDTTSDNHLIEGAKVYLEVYYELEGAYTTDNEEEKIQDPSNQLITLIGWSHLLSFSEDVNLEMLNQLKTAIQRLLSIFGKDGRITMNSFPGIDTYKNKVQEIKLCQLMKDPIINEFINAIDFKKDTNVKI